MRLIEDGIAKLEDTIRRREESEHPEKYVRCLKQDRITLAYMRDRLSRLRDQPNSESKIP